jgi:putative protease
MRLTRDLCSGSSVIADYGFNLMNSDAIALLADLGVKRATVSVEAGHTDLHDIADRASLPLEVLVHGPMPGMLLDHCLLAMYTSRAGRRDVCRGPCRHVGFGLRDRTGQVRPIVADQYCRNHLFAGHDLGILPVLERFLPPAVDSIRIEGQFYSPEQVRKVTAAYRQRLDALLAGHANGTDWHEAWEAALACSPRPVNLGPYVRSVAAERSTATVVQTLAGRCR